MSKSKRIPDPTKIGENIHSRTDLWPAAKLAYLAMLESGEPLTREELAACCGFSLATARKAEISLLKAGLIELTTKEIEVIHRQQVRAGKVKA
jgi:predicted transcriptional regulator